MEIQHLGEAFIPQLSELSKFHRLCNLLPNLGIGAKQSVEYLLILRSL